LEKKGPLPLAGRMHLLARRNASAK